MFKTLTQELLDLRSQSLGRPPDPLAMVGIDCCSCCCCSCWPYPLCIFGV